jgi:peptide/nickel transport system permease protein
VTASSPADVSGGKLPSIARHQRAIALFRLPLVWVVVRRLGLAVPLLFVVSALTFVLVSLTPGDAAREILGPFALREQYLELRQALGLDLPIYEQYWHWLGNAIQGDLGSSLFTQEPVTAAINARLPVTVSLVGGALLVILTGGVGLGVFSAVRGGAAGRVVDAFALVGFAVPAFWLGGVLIVLFAVEMRWLPATGYVPLGQSPGAWVGSLVLPVLALSVGDIAALAKQTREAMLDALGSEYIRMAWANGLSARSIVFRHALKNAATRVVTVLGLHVIGLLSGTVVIENVFALPGLGSLAVDASIRHDLPMMQGVVVYFTVVVVAVNLLVDLAYTWLNPKVRTS